MLSRAFRGMVRYAASETQKPTFLRITNAHVYLCQCSQFQQTVFGFHFLLQARVTVRKDTAWDLFIHCLQPFISLTLLTYSQQKLPSLKLFSFSSPAARHSSTEAHLESKVPIARLIAVRVGVGSVRGICMQTNQTCIDHVRRTCADYC